MFNSNIKLHNKSQAVYISQSMFTARLLDITQLLPQILLHKSHLLLSFCHALRNYTVVLYEAFWNISITEPHGFSFEEDIKEVFNKIVNVSHI